MPKRLILPPFTAAFVESADAKGRCWKMAGSSMRKPYSLHAGGRRSRPSLRPFASTMPVFLATATGQNCRRPLWATRPRGAAAAQAIRAGAKLVRREAPWIMPPAAHRSLLHLLRSHRGSAPVEPRVAVPVLHPASVTVHIKSAALVPDRESAIVEHERLANPETIPMSSLRGKGTSAWRPARNLTPSWRVPPTGVPW